jgi:acetyl-CoA carboxylase biotin carboxyl carrier protein
MELKEIQNLIKLVSDSGVDEVNIEKPDFKLSIRKNEKQVTYMASSPMPVMHSAPSAPSAPAAPHVQPAAPGSQPASQPANEGNIHTIKAPMIGTFYRASSPDKPNFINVGDEIKPGKVLCIIEAMKLFNEIESEVSGKIVKILVENNTPVEYDQPLFLVEKS